MHTEALTPRARPARHPMELMRPSVAFAGASVASAADPRRWLRLILMTLGSVIALLPLLSATAPAVLYGAFPQAS